MKLTKILLFLLVFPIMNIHSQGNLRNNNNKKPVSKKQPLKRAPKRRVKFIVDFAREQDWDSVKKILQQARVSIDVKDNEGYTALMHAVMHLNEEMINILLDRGANLEAKDNLGTTPLMLAVKLAQLPIANLLISRGANPKAKDFDGYTPLMFAAQVNNLPMVRLLVEKGADIRAKTKRGKSVYEFIIGSEIEKYLDAMLKNKNNSGKSS